MNNRSSSGRKHLGSERDKRSGLDPCEDVKKAGPRYGRTRLIRNKPLQIPSGRVDSASPCACCRLVKYIFIFSFFIFHCSQPEAFITHINGSHPVTSLILQHTDCNVAQCLVSTRRIYDGHERIFFNAPNQWVWLTPPITRRLQVQDLHLWFFFTHSHSLYF